MQLFNLYIPKVGQFCLIWSFSLAGATPGAIFPKEQIWNPENLGFFYIPLFL
jgi:hypothetical protein